MDIINTENAWDRWWWEKEYEPNAGSFLCLVFALILLPPPLPFLILAFFFFFFILGKFFVFVFKLNNSALLYPVCFSLPLTRFQIHNNVFNIQIQFFVSLDLWPHVSLLQGYRHKGPLQYSEEQKSDILEFIFLF